MNSSALPNTPDVQPVLDGKRPRSQSLIVHTFVLLPMLALLAAVPLAWG